MNKTKKIILSIMGASDVLITIITPAIIARLWIYFFGVTWSTYVFVSICLLASLFRAIKIGWIKK